MYQKIVVIALALLMTGFLEEARADLILHIDTVLNTATLVGSATADEGAYHSFRGRGPQFGGTTGPNFAVAGPFGTESDSVQHSHMTYFADGISFTSQSDLAVDLGVLLTGNGIARSLTIQQRNDLAAFNGSVFTGLGSTSTLTVTTTAVPEPSSLAVLGLGLAGLVWRRRRRLALMQS